MMRTGQYGEVRWFEREIGCKPDDETSLLVKRFITKRKIKVLQQKFFGTEWDENNRGGFFEEWVDVPTVTEEKS